MRARVLYWLIEKLLNRYMKRMPGPNTPFWRLVVTLYLMRQWAAGHNLNFDTAVATSVDEPHDAAAKALLSARGHNLRVNEEH